VIQASRFRVHSDARADGACLRLEEELDIATVPDVAGALAEELAAGARRVVTDLRGLRFIDSSGLRELIVLADRARSEGCELALVRPGEPAIDVLPLSGAEQNLPFVDPEKAEG
jgi:anti-anti-sigma factor